VEAARGLTVIVGHRNRTGSPTGAQRSPGPVSVTASRRTCCPPGPVAKLMLPALTCPRALAPRGDPAFTNPLYRVPRTTGYSGAPVGRPRSRRAKIPRSVALP